MTPAPHWFGSLPHAQNTDRDLTLTYFPDTKAGHTGRYLYRDVYMCVGMCIDMCTDMSMGMSMDFYVDMCIGICTVQVLPKPWRGSLHSTGFLTEWEHVKEILHVKCPFMSLARQRRGCPS